MHQTLANVYVIFERCMMKTNEKGSCLASTLIRKCLTIENRKAYQNFLQKMLDNGKLGLDTMKSISEYLREENPEFQEDDVMNQILSEEKAVAYRGY